MGNKEKQTPTGLPNGQGVEAGSQELSSGLPYGGQGPSDLSHHVLPPRMRMRRKL